jgi:aspartyl-tRNA(Asn)/glutamyl-tRNA(Gln) amidotransferase subunit C
MRITEQDVRYVADLANLELTDAERVAIAKDLSSILDYVTQLSELDTSGVEPMAQVSQIASLRGSERECLRDDKLQECLPHDLALAKAPQSDGTFFRVPKVIER